MFDKASALLQIFRRAFLNSVMVLPLLPEALKRLETDEIMSKPNIDNLFFEFTDDEVFYICRALQYHIDCMEHPDIGKLEQPNTPPNIPRDSTLDAEWQMGEDLRYRMGGPVFARLKEKMKAE